MRTQRLWRDLSKVCLHLSPACKLVVAARLQDVKACKATGTLCRGVLLSGWREGRASMWPLAQPRGRTQA